MALSKPRMDYSLYKFRTFPDYECRVMAFVLYTFKLLFALDDFTEFHQSKFAEAVNERRKQSNVQEVPKLFVWTSWIRYIECRKAVLAEYDVSVNQLFYDARIDNQKVFLGHWDKVKPIYEANERNINLAFLSSLQSDVRMLLNECEIHDPSMNISFPASVEPFKSSINYIMTKYPVLLSKNTRDVLSEEFTSCSMKYILDEKWCDKLIELFKMKCEIKFDSEEVEIRQYEKSEENLPLLSRTTVPPADTPTLVHIKNDTEIQNKNQMTLKCLKAISETRVYDSESNFNADVEKEIDHSDYLKMYNPSRRYWFFHEFHRRISIEQFNTLIRENLSNSFTWLLKECAAMLRVDLKELYLELIQVETVLCRDYFDGKYDKKVPLKLFSNEW